MAGTGSPPGVRRGGRQKGTPNKATAEARATVHAVFEKLAPEVEGWILAVAEKDPARAAELVLRLAEYFVPKLARTEVAGAEDAEPLVVVIDLCGGSPQGPRCPPTWSRGSSPPPLASVPAGTT